MSTLARVWDSDIAYSFRQSPVAIGATIVALVMVLSAVLAAWVAPHNPLFALMATPGAGGQGQFNLGSYSNAKVDELTKAIAIETDVKKRNAMIAEAMKIHQDDFGHIPLHQQALAWAMKKNVDLVQLADNYMFLKWVTVK